MTKSKEPTKAIKPEDGNSPLPKFSIFSRGPQFGTPQKLGNQRPQFKPLAPRITQNKGGGGK